LPPDPTIPRRLVPVLLLYAVLSVAYGWLVLVAILWFFWMLLEPQGLAPAFWVLATIVLSGAAVPPVRAAIGFWSRPGRRYHVRRGRATLAALVAIAAVAILVFVPLPYRIS